MRYEEGCFVAIPDHPSRMFDGDGDEDNDGWEDERLEGRVVFQRRRWHGYSCGSWGLQVTDDYVAGRHQPVTIRDIDYHVDCPDSLERQMCHGRKELEKSESTHIDGKSL